MMKRIAFVMAILLVAAPFLAAQQTMKEKKVSDEITFAEKVKVGDSVVPAGHYLVVCDHVSMAFINYDTNVTVLRVPCKGKELNAKVKTTEVYLAKASDGSTFVEKLLLKGSNIEHVF